MKKLNTSKKDETDYKRLDAMTDEDIDFSDLPAATPEMSARGVSFPPLHVRAPREALTVRLDRDVAKWYREKGPQYHALVNLLLRGHMQEQERKRRKSRTRRAS